MNGYSKITPDVLHQIDLNIQTNLEFVKGDALGFDTISP